MATTPGNAWRSHPQPCSCITYGAPGSLLAKHTRRASSSDGVFFSFSFLERWEFKEWREFWNSYCPNKRVILFLNLEQSKNQTKNKSKETPVLKWDVQVTSTLRFGNTVSSPPMQRIHPRATPDGHGRLGGQCSLNFKDDSHFITLHMRFGTTDTTNI